MFGDRHLAARKPIAEEDRAVLIAGCITSKDKINKVRRLFYFSSGLHKSLKQLLAR
jgi:hypothetical protein